MVGTRERRERGPRSAGVGSCSSGASGRGAAGGISIISQVIGTGVGVLVALVGGFLVYGVLKAAVGIRLSQEDEFNGADLSIHRIGALSHD